MKDVNFKILFITAGIFIYSCCCFSQNLVPNYSFEDTTNCPSNHSQLYNSKFWFNPTYASPDYYNTCATNSYISIPYNQIGGYQQTKTGNAYVGFTAYATDIGVEYREYVECKLLDSLKTGKKYCVEFYVSLSDSSKGATKNIGLFFSFDSLLQTGWQHLPVIPQIESDSFLSDTGNWMLVSGEFIAQGGERFITIGNFRSDATTSVMDMDTIPCTQGNNCGIYYYIDDVSVYCCDSTGCGGVGNEELIIDNGKLRVYPNPTKGSFKLEGLNFETWKSGNFEIKIYDLIGRRIYDFGFTISGQYVTIDCKNWNSGVYFVEVGDKRGRVVVD